MNTVGFILCDISAKKIQTHIEQFQIMAINKPYTNPTQNTQLKYPNLQDDEHSRIYKFPAHWQDSKLNTDISV